MPQDDQRRDDSEDSLEMVEAPTGLAPRFARPRPSAVVAALFVAASLVWIVFLDPSSLAMDTANRFGWPLSFRLLIDTMSHPSAPAPSLLLVVAVVAVNLALGLALVASALVTTHIGACLLVGKSRTTVRSLCLTVVAVALFLGLCRWQKGFLMHALYWASFYGVASLIMIVTALLIRLELPRADRPGPRV